MNLDRSRISQRFGSAVEHYDQAAKPQLAIATQLSQMIESSFQQRPRRVLEVGCGTGLLSYKLTELLGWSDISYSFNDLVPGVEPFLRNKLGDHAYDFIPGDAERLEWDRGYDLIASSSCVQWWSNPLSYIAKAYDAMAEGGLLALSTFLPGNLTEIDTLVEKPLNYPAAEAWYKELERYGFEVINSDSQVFTLHFPTLFRLLRHLKETGTNALNSNHGGLWTPRHLDRLESELRLSLGLEAYTPIPLTYKAILITARK